MKIYYEEIDGMPHPKLMLFPYSPTSTNSRRVIVNLIGPFEHMHQEDFHDDFKGLTISQGEMLRNRFGDKSFSIDLNLVEDYLVKSGISPTMLNEIDYFVMLIDEIEELMQMDIKRFYLD